MGLCRKSDELFYHTKSMHVDPEVQKDPRVRKGRVDTVISSFVFYQDSNNSLNKSGELVRLNNHKNVKIP